MDFYVETGNFVDFLSTFWQILRFPFGLFLVFSCFFLFCRFTVFILPAYTVPGNKCCCLLLKTKSYYWNTELLLALLPVPSADHLAGCFFIGINIFRLQDRINTGNGCSLRILFQMEVTADKGTYFLIQKQLGALLLHLPFFY